VTAPTARTRVIALLGDPVEHSLSPRLQNTAFRTAGVDGVYVAVRCDADAVAGLLLGIARAGGGGNVTVPHKERAAALVERRTEAVERTGACNTFWLENGAVWGDNTDVLGFQDAVRAVRGTSARGARVLLLGAGGAARAALAGLHAHGASEVVLLNRSPARAESLVRAFAGGSTRLEVRADASELRGERFDLAVNATSLGLRPSDPLPLPSTAEVELSAALDLVYAPGGTPWVRGLAAAGVAAADGTEMLLRQGAAAFERWWGAEAPLAAMRAALAPTP
jgi:shikimate dehydrogenase